MKIDPNFYANHPGLKRRVERGDRKYLELEEFLFACSVSPQTRERINKHSKLLDQIGLARNCLHRIDPQSCGCSEVATCQLGHVEYQTDNTVSISYCTRCPDGPNGQGEKNPLTQIPLI